MRNKAFKMWMVKAFSGDVEKTAAYIVDVLQDQGQMGYELMEEADAEYNIDGFRKAAMFAIKEVQHAANQPISS